MNQYKLLKRDISLLLRSKLIKKHLYNEPLLTLLVFNRILLIMFFLPLQIGKRISSLNSKLSAEVFKDSMLDPWKINKADVIIFKTYVVI